MDYGRETRHNGPMIVNMIIKILFFYFAFLLIRNIWRGFRVVGHIKKNMNEAQGRSNPFENFQNQGQNNPKKPSQAGDIEAEFRHIDPK